MSLQPPKDEPLADPVTQPDPPIAAGPEVATQRVPWEPAPAMPSEPASAKAPAAAPPSVLWATPSRTGPANVPGASDLAFAATWSRLIAYVIDVFLLSLLWYSSVFVVFLVQGWPTTDSDVSRSISVNFLLLAALSAAYFVWFWSGGRRATPGQRLFGIQVGNAFDGRSLTATQAFRRWIALGWFLVPLATVQALGSARGLAVLVWSIVLLSTTVRSPEKQGLHDRFANSALVRPRRG